MDKQGTELNAGQEWGEEKPTERTCLICSCTDSKACEGGCSWIDGLGDICNKCIIDRVPECIDLLVETIKALHRDNDIDEGTPTMDLCLFARKIVKALQQ